MVSATVGRARRKTGVWEGAADGAGGTSTSVAPGAEVLAPFVRLLRGRRGGGSGPVLARLLGCVSSCGRFRPRAPPREGNALLRLPRRAGRYFCHGSCLGIRQLAVCVAKVTASAPLGLPCFFGLEACVLIRWIGHRCLHQDIRQTYLQHGSNSKSSAAAGPFGHARVSAVATTAAGEGQKNHEDGVALPLGPTFIGIDVDVRHGHQRSPRGAAAVETWMSGRLGSNIWFRIKNGTTGVPGRADRAKAVAANRCRGSDYRCPVCASNVSLSSQGTKSTRQCACRSSPSFNSRCM